MVSLVEGNFRVHHYRAFRLDTFHPQHLETWMWSNFQPCIFHLILWIRGVGGFRPPTTENLIQHRRPWQRIKDFTAFQTVTFSSSGVVWPGQVHLDHQPQQTDWEVERVYAKRLSWLTSLFLELLWCFSPLLQGFPFSPKDQDLYVWHK